MPSRSLRPSSVGEADRSGSEGHDELTELSLAAADVGSGVCNESAGTGGGVCSDRRSGDEPDRDRVVHVDAVTLRFELDGFDEGVGDGSRMADAVNQGGQSQLASACLIRSLGVG